MTMSPGPVEEAGGSCVGEELTVKVKAAGRPVWAGQSYSLRSLTRFAEGFRFLPSRTPQAGLLPSPTPCAWWGR